ncbi:CMP-N-acetylneuraminate-poly-alpha-2,8-sialyltransferase-like [Branchiostoma floridae]|uniref:CMP-N-acetylneuraminate-poly-alpha-2, 8-sialyltransferase-like n=2 Tax=Branchiostoma floridae TaxID=7739 RepID=A0A9J7MSU2_BRAFL|nr:CMP-N-acetylneuraminate-poly-alpha-2,8-sialyltransferase-like [Branchiostoma floridae]
MGSHMLTFEHLLAKETSSVIMSLQKCNTSRILRRGLVLLIVLTLVMLYISLYKLSSYADPRFHPKTPRSFDKNTAKIFIKEFLVATSRWSGSEKADSTNQTSVQNNKLSGTIIAPQNGSKKRFNSAEVKNMRKHILKFYNPDRDLTLRKSGLRVGQQLRYEMKWGNKTSLNVTKDFLKLIPEESPLKDRHFYTCAVVGNSGILLNSSCGQEIDSMDFVIRCNLPQIEGYEKDVGSKANLTTMNPSVIGQHFGQWDNKTTDDYDRLLRRLDQVGDQILYIPTLTSSVGDQWVSAIIQILLQHKLTMKTPFPPARINTVVKSIWRKAGFKILALRPSTGAHMYTLAATICDQIHMYGFYPFSEDTRGRALRYHYYDTNTEMIGNKTHSMPEEFRTLRQLHMRGALVLHTEPCR